LEQETAQAAAIFHLVVCKSPNILGYQDEGQKCLSKVSDKYLSHCQQMQAPSTRQQQLSPDLATSRKS
jgi:hypothetical protein